MAMSLVASTGGIALMPLYARNLLPATVVSRPLAGVAPTIDLSLGDSAPGPGDPVNASARDGAAPSLFTGSPGQAG